MNLLDGKQAKAKILESLKEKTNKLDTRLGFVVIQIGEDPASSIYNNQKEKMAHFLNYDFKNIKLAETVSEEEVIGLINTLNNDDTVDGILVQMPIPKSLNAKRIQNAIHPLKDVDGLTDVNAGKLVHDNDALVPCTPAGVLDLLNLNNIEVSGKNVVIIGRSNLVGKPLATLLSNHNATVTLCHSKTNNLKEHTRLADILIVAIGKPNSITKDYVKDGSVVIDVGINRLEKNKLCGDVDFDSVAPIVSYITPVPGGVGPMTVAHLAKNIYKAHILRTKQL